jgi:DNA-binding response OmpR family regulator
LSAQDDEKKIISPASNSELPLNPDGSVDVDRVRIKLLILCRNKKHADPIATYLIRRGWETVVTTNLKESFKVVTAFKPDFVLLSVNIPSPKLASLPGVLFQTFRTPVITFGEDSDAKTMMVMQTIQSNYKINGAASGPSVHRRVKQILQETHKGNSAVDIPNANENETEQATGEAASNKGKTQKDSNLMRFSHDQKNDGPSMVINKGAQSKEGSSALMSTSSIDLDALAAEFDVPTKLENVDKAGTQSKDLFAQIQTTKSASHAATNEQSPAKMAEVIGAGVPIISLDSNDREHFDKTIKNEEALIQSLFGESKVNQALKVIALKSALPLELSSDEITVLEECTLIPIKILRKMAYIIIVVTGTIHDEIQYISRFLGNLRHDLTANFEMVTIFDETRLGIGVDLDHIDKAEEEKGTFTFSLRTGRGYASMLLVYENSFNATVYEEEHSPKVRININELIPDVPVGVDIFLHLPKNNKDYLYLKPASSITEEQKERLTKKNAKLFVDKKDVAAYKGAVRRNKSIEPRVVNRKSAKKKIV